MWIQSGNFQKRRSGKLLKLSVNQWLTCSLLGPILSAKGFFSWKKDPEAEAIDAFTRNWAEEGLFWAFPPFSVILRVLQKIKAEGAEGIVVLPDWSNHPWYPLFTELVISEKLFFKPSRNLFLSPCRTLIHPIATSLVLIVAVLSGKR